MLVVVLQALVTLLPAAHVPQTAQVAALVVVE
jgi:hypothetical protein